MLEQAMLWLLSIVPGLVLLIPGMLMGFNNKQRRTYREIFILMWKKTMIENKHEIRNSLLPTGRNSQALGMKSERKQSEFRTGDINQISMHPGFTLNTCNYLLKFSSQDTRSVFQLTSNSVSILRENDKTDVQSICSNWPCQI